MLEALEKTLGVVTPALKSANVARGTFYGWLKDDPKFRDAVDALPDIALDFAESKLHKLIKDENPTAIIFYLKTKGKKRGYVERIEQENVGVTEIHFNNISQDYEFDENGKSIKK